MPRNRNKVGIFDSHGLPKPIVETVQTTARPTTHSTDTRPLIEYDVAPKQRPRQNGQTLTQSTLMPELANGFTYTVRERSDSLSLQHVAALKKTCESMATYFEENSVTSFSSAKPTNSDEVYFLNRGGRVMFAEPIAMYKSPGPAGKTYGVIRLEGENIRFKAASGWGKRDHDDSLRDNEFCSAQVLQFCNLLGFKLRRNCWDKTKSGRYAACHVEKKLMLMLVLDLIYDHETRNIVMSRLHELWERGLRAQIYIDKDPCPGCKNFALELEQGTNIHFDIIVAKTFVEAEFAKVNGKKELQERHTAQTGQSQLSISRTKRSRKAVDYSIPEISTAWKSKSRGKRKRMLDGDDENDETFIPRDFQTKAKGLPEKPRIVHKISKTKSNSISYHLGKPVPTYNAPKDIASNKSHPTESQLRSKKVDMKSTKLVSPLGSTKYTNLFQSRGTGVGHYSTAEKGSELHSHAVPSERSRAIAELQQANNGLLPRPVNHNLPTFHRVPSPSSTRARVYSASDDSDSISLRSSRTASPEDFTLAPPARPINVFLTPETTPLKRRAERINAPEPVTPSRSVQRLHKKRTPTKSAISSSRPSNRVIPRSIDLTTPEPSPLSMIKQYQYTPPSKSSKHHPPKKVLPAVKFSYNNT